MENRANLVEFDEKENYYMCKSCKTHIALAQDFNCLHYITLGIEQTGGIFNNVVNVRVDDPDQHQPVEFDDDYTLAYIYCVSCGDQLGWKFIRRVFPNMIHKKDIIKLDMKKLLRKQDGQILDAETNQAVIQNP